MNFRSQHRVRVGRVGLALAATAAFAVITPATTLAQGGCTRAVCVQVQFPQGSGWACVSNPGGTLGSCVATNDECRITMCFLVATPSYSSEILMQGECARLGEQVEQTDRHEWIRRDTSTPIRPQGIGSGENGPRNGERPAVRAATIILGRAGG